MLQNNAAVALMHEKISAVEAVSMHSKAYSIPKQN